ncbi:MAG: hypothetical protein U1F83_00190 [Verrucomicrobiota bacterium]
MQTSKFLLAMGALAAVVLPLQVQAGPDNAEQAKMREVLRRMMDQSTVTNAPVPTVTPPAAPAPVKPVVVTAPPPVPRPVVAPVTPVAPPPVVVAVPAAVTVAAPAAQFEAVPPPDNAASLAQAREALRKKMAELQATTPVVATAPVAPAPTTTPITPVVAATPKRGNEPVFAPAYAPIQAPDSPLSGAKQAKLADLLARYKADAITAQDYHTQRAAILAGQ